MFFSHFSINFHHFHIVFAIICRLEQVLDTNAERAIRFTKNCHRGSVNEPVYQFLGISYLYSWSRIPYITQWCMLIKHTALLYVAYNMFKHSATYWFGIFLAPLLSFSRIHTHNTPSMKCIQVGKEYSTVCNTHATLNEKPKTSSSEHGRCPCSLVHVCKRLTLSGAHLSLNNRS